MAEAGSSGLQSAGGSNVTATRSALGFPDLDGSQPPHRSTRPERTTNMNTLGLGYPSSSRRPSSGGRISSMDSNSSRRRVRSMPGDDDVFPPGPSRLRHIHDMEVEPHRRVASLTRRGTGKQRAVINLLGNAEGHLDYSAAPFSEEYDLSHEDPRILEDVQRALHLKARREARLKALQGKKQPAELAVPSDQGSTSSFSSRASPARAKASEPLPPVLPTTQVRSSSVESEVDFSPSIGAAPNHPVPSSSDHGATLDWTASSSDDERDRRWPMLAKRRAKEKGIANRAVVENQESLYSEKLAQIKARIKPHTLRKAAITAEQLQRRYSVLLDPSRPANLLNVVRWYSKQDALTRTALDNAQPLTWLKHLLDKRAKSGSARLPWHLTALIIEEYAKSSYPPLQSIPEGREVTEEETPGTSSLDNSTSSPSNSKTSPGLGGSSSWSWVANQTLEPSLSRKRQDTNEDIVSFEPQVDSGRSSAGGDSRRSSYDFKHGRKQSVAHTSLDSPGSSLRNVSVGNYGLSTTPSSRMREFANRMRRRPYERSEEALSSGRNSISEQSHGEDGGLSGKGRRRSRPLSLQSPTGVGGGGGGVISDADEHATRDIDVHSDCDGSKTARDPTGSMHFGEQTITGKESEEHLSSSNTSALPTAKPKPIRRLRGRRQSLPSLDQLLLHEQEKQQQQATEEQERREYKHKLQLLDDTLDQNRRTRQLLQRVGAQIREYENVQSRLSDLLGRPYVSVPVEVLDALSHDPASVIGPTKRYKGWRAVEDIHERIRLQRQTLRDFADTLADTQTGDRDEEDSAFKEILDSLSKSLEELHGHRLGLTGDAEEVAEALVEVKESHAAVKKEYNEVMAHTSLIYPQISQIVALEENYRNKYQQIWDIGLDALTLLLDTVTPVWRNYGKVIGEDVQDFLIIPWYRNEFTGEKQRYPIKHLPRRSFRHWIGLLMFMFVSVGVLVLQTGAALTSTTHYNLPWITNSGVRWLIIPFFTIGLFIQWTSVVVECCIILAQIGVIMWWIGWAVRLCH